MMTTIDINDFDSQIDMRMIAFIDAFMTIFPHRDDAIEIMNAHSRNCEFDSIDELIIDFIDAQFDDKFAIICDDDDDAYSLFDEFINRMNESQNARFINCMHNRIRIALIS
jgi:hypothetical protein